MSKAAFVLVALIAATAAGSASATSLIMADPVLIKMPSSADLAGVAPAAAKAGGWAQLGCRLAHDGGLQDCAVLHEHPVRSGFGQAAVRATQRFHMGAVDNGRSPSDGTLVLPVIFNHAD